MHRHVAGAFAHDLDAAFPGTLRQIALGLQLGKLSLVIGVCDGTGTKTVTDGETNVIGRHDVTDIIPMGIEEILLMMRKAPLGQD